MNTIAKVVSLISLIVTVLPSGLYFVGMIDLGMVKTLTLVGTIGWFISTPLWMGRKLPVDAAEVEI